MKRILRIIVIEIVGLYAASQIATGIVFQNELEGLLITGAALGVASYLIKPIVNLLLLPLTLATLGLFKFISNAITLFIVDLALPQVTITSFDFSGLSTEYFELPPISFANPIAAYISFSVIIFGISSFANWIRK